MKSPADGKPGEAAGRLDLPRGIAASSSLPGDVYAIDAQNARVSEFTPWGEFVRAWGWGVDDGTPEPQVCSEESGCQKGIGGSSAGQLSNPEAIAVDSAGDVYLMEASAGRVQKFDSAGNFLFAFGESGSGPGQFGGGLFGYLGKLAVSPLDDTLFVGEAGRIQSFEPDGSFVEEIELPPGKQLRGLAAGPDGTLYASFAGEPAVRKLEPTGAVATFLEPSFEALSPGALAVDAAGHLYAVVDSTGETEAKEPERVLEFAPDGACLNCGAGGEGGKPGFDRSPSSVIRAIASGDACGPPNVYTTHFNPAEGNLQSFFNVFGAPPDPGECPPPVRPPEIEAQYAVAVDTEGAELRAEISPQFWTDTSYYLEYGAEPCFEGGCEPAGGPPGRRLTTKVTNVAVPTVGVFLDGLEPRTTYHYRFVAESSGGGPVVGLAGETGAAAEATFTTFAEPEPRACPGNEAFRGGPAATLPDCRAYELVSPLDKANGDIVVLNEFTTGQPAVLSQSSVLGDRLAFGSFRAFGGAEAAAFTTQYVAARDPGGWNTHPITPPHGRAIVASPGNFDTEFKRFSADLCDAWMVSFAEPPLAPGAPQNVQTPYRRGDEECGGESYEALNTATPPSLAGAGFDLEIQAVSADGGVAAFSANDQLAAGATAGETQLYVSSGGQPRFACVLPGGAAHEGSCLAGGNVGGASGGKDRTANAQGALSADGSRLFWTAASNGLGPIYMRQNPLGEGGECSGGEAPCTIAVSQAAEAEAGSSGSLFWAAASDGSRAIFTTGGRLYEFDAVDESTHLIAARVRGVLGVGEDAARAYLASEEALDAGAVAGVVNLYIHEAGEFSFIGALEGEDLPGVGRFYSPIAAEPRFRTSRVSADGLHAAFKSVAPLSGYDNLDSAGGQAAAEVYLYDAAAGGGAGELICASCNPSGARPRAAGVQGEPSAAWIPAWQNSGYASRALSSDGRRLFFNSADPLTPLDTNGRADVYQWEAAGSGDCALGGSSYVPTADGCVDLISSGKSERDAELVDASPSGNDVFFATLSGLVGHDYGLVDIYDARVGGGLPPPPPPVAPCEGDSCQPQPRAGEDAAPSSMTFDGPGDRRSASKPRRCPRGKRRAVRAGKRRCVPRRKRAQARRGGHRRVRRPAR